MVPSRLFQRLKSLVSPRGSTELQAPERKAHSTGRPETDEPLLQLFDELLDIDDLPQEYRELFEIQQGIAEHNERMSPHWGRVQACMRSSTSDTDPTPHQEYRETERLAQCLRDAFDADYKHYARGHHLTEQLLTNAKGIEALDDKGIESIQWQLILFDTLREYAMSNFWAMSIRHNGMRLMFLDPDDELGNRVIHHEAKRQTSDLILSTTTMVETVGQTLLELHGDPVDPRENLNNIIDKLAANELISDEEREKMHSVRKMRNAIAHDMVKRTTLDWVDDFQELVLNCFTTVNAVKYPLHERLESELPPDVADEYIEALFDGVDVEKEWESTISDSQSGYS